MIKAFNSFINSLVSQTDSKKYLLAISGGIDSMVMLNLFQQTKLKFSVANINFKLRGEEADNEAIFVKNYCTDNNINLYQTEFDTETYAKENKVSIQMAARDLRYQWFAELAKQKQYDLIAIAHHLDDQSETFFINILRGTGIAGLHGIAKLKDNIIRPLLFANREDISKYALLNNIPYKDDSSNASDKYQRNYIRHHILPEFYKLRADFSLNLDNTISHLAEIEDFAAIYIKKELESILENSKYGILQIQTNRLIDNKHSKLLLYSLLKDYGFYNSHIIDIIEIVSNRNSGKTIESNSHIVSIDRDFLILEKKTQKEILNINISSLEEFTLDKCDIKVEFPFIGNYKTDNNNLAFLDIDLIEFPLTIRNWQQGDSFKPLGMKGEKKLSDFFIDNKISISEKKSIKLLCQNNKIIWVIGHRIDNRYRITKNTKRIIKLEYHGNN